MNLKLEHHVHARTNCDCVVHRRGFLRVAAVTGAAAMNDLAIIRSMTSKEGSHPRATFLLHHGYLPMGGVKFPTLGSHVAKQLGTPGFDLPSFVRIGGRGGDAGGAGFLGVDYDP